MTFGKAIPLSLSIVLLFHGPTAFAELPLGSLVSQGEATKQLSSPEFMDEAPSLRPISIGMSFQQVLKTVGPAPEKTECETSRRHRWSYGSGEILFREGKVIGVEVPMLGFSSKEPRYDHDSVAAKVSPHGPQLEKELLEILKEIPSGPDGPGDGAVSIPPPGVPPPPPPLQLNPGSSPFLHGGGERMPGMYED